MALALALALVWASGFLIEIFCNQYFTAATHKINERETRRETRREKVKLTAVEESPHPAPAHDGNWHLMPDWRSSNPFQLQQVDRLVWSL